MEIDNKKPQRALKEPLEVPKCPRCTQKGVVPPNPRAVSPSGHLQGYCKSCWNEYQKERNNAKAVLRRYYLADPNTLAEEDKSLVDWAVATLSTKPRGRPKGAGVCPRCKVNPRTPYSSYCKECDKTYRRSRREVVEREVAEAYEKLREPTLSTNTIDQHSDWSYIDPKDLQSLRQETEK